MNKPVRYSKYQKNVIKFLTSYLDIDTPFTYERTQNNHLKVLIAGVDKPLFTGSTPSDCKSFANFSAEVKRELKASRVEAVATDDSKPTPPLSSDLPQPHEKLLKGCIKSLRSRLEAIKSKEQEKVLESRSLEVIQAYRNNVVRRSIELALQNRRDNYYIKAKDKKSFEDKVTKYMDFMLPTLAQYTELLESKASLSKNVNMLRASNETSNGSAIRLPEPQQGSLEQEQVKTASRPDLSHKAAEVTTTSSPATEELMKMSVSHRVALLRTLSKAQALQLIDDINQAQALNREQDIEAVVSLIKEKGIPLEAIIARLDAE